MRPNACRPRRRPKVSLRGGSLFVPLLVATLVFVAVAARSPLPCTAAGLTQDVLIEVPRYQLTKVGQYDRMTIPGGSHLAVEDGRPLVPVFVRTYTYPPGQIVQDVALVGRSAAETVAGLRLEPVVTSIYAEPPTEPLAGWYPNRTHDWTFTREASGAGTLSVIVFPVYYEAQTDQAQFFSSSTFRVTVAASTVAIEGLVLADPSVAQGAALRADLLIRSSAAAQDVALQAAVFGDLGGPPVGTLPGRVLRGLAGEGQVSLEWSSAGVAPGSYSLVVSARDLAGNLLDQRHAAFGILSGAAEFVIGQPWYAIGGTRHAMDVAPYIKASRTFLPVRFVAYACGVADAGVAWDAVTRTVGLTKGNVRLSLQIGSRTLRVTRGTTVTTLQMDVAPELTLNRTMLPVRWVAEQFDYTVGWDQGTQTVRLEP